MNIQTLLETKVKEGFIILFETTIPSVEFQATRKDFEGDITIVIFPMLRYKKGNPVQIGETIGKYLVENIEEVVFNTVKILKKLSNGKFSKEYLENVKKSYMVDHYTTCQNNSFITDFYGQQYINQLYNIGETPNILTFKEVSEEILRVTKMNFVLFVKRLLIFSNMKIAYQGKREVKNLQSLVLKRI